MHHRSIVAVLGIFLLSDLTAQAQVDLRWKFKQDDHFFLKEENTVKQTMEFGGARSTSETKTTTVHSFTVKKADEKAVVLEQKIESVEIRSNAELRTIDALADVLKGSTFTITLSPGGEILKYEGYDDLARKFGKLGENAAKMLKATVTEKSLRSVLVRAFSFQPEPFRRVKPGESWARTFTMPFGPIGTFEEKNKYSLTARATEGADRDLHIIDVQLGLSYEPPGPNVENPFPFKIVKGVMSADDARATIAFDAEKGRPTRYDMTMKVSGKISVKAGTEEGTVAIEQDQTMKLQVLDKAP
jgi:hypothetical protein